MLELHGHEHEESPFLDPEIEEEEKSEESKHFWLLIIICSGKGMTYSIV